MAMIREKLKGHKPIIAAAPERGNVINLMDALKASLGQAKPPHRARSQGRAGREKDRRQADAKTGGGSEQGGCSEGSGCQEEGLTG